MQRFLYILMTLILIAALVAIFTKPSYDESYNKVKTALEAAHHKVGLFLSHEKDSKDTASKVYSALSVRDRIFYREIYYFEFGKNKKVAIAAFRKIYLLDPEK